MRGFAAAVKITQARSEAELAVARRLFEEYAARLGVDLCFQDFRAELDRLDSMYGLPTGCLLLAWSDDEPVGCVGARRLCGTVCEMKRLYVRDGMRGRGVGRRLAAMLIERARGLGYRRMVLDTLAVMTEARGLYASLWFRECAAYYANPLPGVTFMELHLGDDDS